MQYECNEYDEKMIRVSPRQCNTSDTVPGNMSKLRDPPADSKK